MRSPAVVALFLYSLLPIIRNTYTGLMEISVDIRLTNFGLILQGAIPAAILAILVQAASGLLERPFTRAEA